MTETRRRRLRIDQIPKSILCIPLVIQWLLLAIRFRSLTLPSCLNPAIETGGLAGESKSACLAQIGPDFAHYVADWHLVAAGEDAIGRMRQSGLAYPIIAKPDIGWCGYGVRRVNDDQGLTSYAAAFPGAAAFIIQRLITAPHEAGLFYVRAPGETAGRVLAMTLRHAPHIVGDGVHTVAALATQAGLAHHLMPSVGGAACGHDVPPPGIRVTLTTVASLRVGATYQDAAGQITPALTAHIDAIARSMPDFHLGRFDVRFATIEALQNGEFHIIEVNGAGSEAIHLWDPAVPILAAFRGVFAKQQMLFQLGAEMRALGHHPVGPLRLAIAWCHQQRLIRRYPKSN